MARMKVQLQLSGTIRHDPETGTFVSHCPELNLYSAGNSELEALEAIRSAVSLFLQSAYERKKLGEIFEKLNLRFSPIQEAPTDPPLRVGEFDTQQLPINVPFYLLQEGGHIRGAGA
jgi:predicted RNase H-like HicB family nuclease